MSTMTQVAEGLRTNAADLDRMDMLPMLAGHLRNAADAIDAHRAQPAQATTCAGCGEHKATPLRIDAMGGYVCLTCIDQKLSSLLGEFGYPESQSAQAADVGAIREVIAELREYGISKSWTSGIVDKLTSAISTGDPK